MAQAMIGDLQDVLKVVFSWECLASTVTYIELCIVLDMNRSRHIQLLLSIQRLDKDMSAIFPHIQWHYEKTRRKYNHGTILINTVFFTLSLVFVFFTVNCTCGFASSLIGAITYSVLTANCGMLGFLHAGFLDLLRVRFRLIVKLLHQLYAQRSDVQRNLEEQELHQRIEKLFEFSKRCSQYLVDVNNVFRFVSIIGIFYDFSVMTCFGYIVLQNIIESKTEATEYVFVSLLIAMHLYKVIVTASYGHLLHREKRNCHQLLNKYETFFECEHLVLVRSLVDSFQHWLKHNDYSATIGAHLRCDVYVIYMVLNAVANYVIILVQLLFQQTSLEGPTHRHVMSKDVEIIKP
ncbi:putative gustatory receptor 47b [Scaptodrosophila lebanonensis]|uniref:Gustatory receptor n=1 Tax=Drosophila lebanonensis TaxID=7225 RepID=A0A6J2UID8_DROLE|nr:putative gustatory receptor 47b [Scaptodrosophila lebanonensis]